MTDEMQLMGHIDWQPKHALFQLSPNKQYGRHGKRPMSDNKLRDIIHEVQKAWGQKPFAQDDWYWYFKRD